MTILITGGCGFLGSFITEYLVQKGFDVIITTRNIQKCWRLQHQEKYKFEQGNLNNKEFIQRIFKKNIVDVVIHLAWEGINNKERDDVKELDNITYSRYLLELAGEQGIKLFIGLGSQAEYGVSQKKINEDMLPKPISLYGIAKWTVSQMGLLYAKKYDFNYAWLRLFPLFGPRDNPEYMIPYAIISLLKNIPPKLTLCEQKLDLLYVKDVPKLIGNIINSKKKFQDVYNICSGKVVCLKNLIYEIKSLVSSSANPCFGAIPYRGDGLMKVHGVNTKFKNFFGWIKITPRKQALLETIDFYKKKCG